MSFKKFTRKSLLLATVGLGVLATSGQAGAVVVGPIDLGSYQGPIEIQYNGFSTETNVTAGSNETTWAAGFITSIYQFGNNSNIFYSNALPGIDRIGVFVYGIADGNARGTAPNFELFNVGCTGGPCDGKIHADLYLLPNGASTDFGTTLSASDRTGFNTFTGITDGTPFMQWEFVPGIQSVDLPNDGTDTVPGFDETLATLFQNVDALTLPATGNGNFYAACVSGSGCSAFNNNGYPNGADFFGQFTLSGGLTSAQQSNGWEGRISDPIETATAVPEPGTLALIGSGLLGLLGLGRRRRRNG